MDKLDVIRTRKSVRTFDGRPLREEDRAKLAEFIRDIPNPYGISVELVLLDAEENDLSSPVIEGEHLYIAGKVDKQKHGEEAFGYSFEKMVLFAWSLGIGTTWIGGTLDRPHFESVIGIKGPERMYAVTPLGYPGEHPSEVDRKLRASVHGDNRLPENGLFFESGFATPLNMSEIDPPVAQALDAVRWAPSAANMQPWRIVKDGNRYHFFECHTKRYDEENYGDVQKLDMGIALCHFMEMAGGDLIIEDPEIRRDENLEYIATVRL